MNHYSQFDEDRWLWERLGHISPGQYIDVGANDPQGASVSYAFYEQGWAGVTVEPQPRLAALHRELRPRDRLFEAVATSTDGEEHVFHLVSLHGLSTLRPEYAERYARAGLTVEELKVTGLRLDTILEAVGWEPGPAIHFAKIDVEGAEAEVFAGFSLLAWQPWYLVVEAVEPFRRAPSHSEWEPGVLASGYELVHDDGVNRFYRARHKSEPTEETD